MGKFLEIAPDPSSVFRFIPSHPKALYIFFLELVCLLFHFLPFDWFLFVYLFIYLFCLKAPVNKKSRINYPAFEGRVNAWLHILSLANPNSAHYVRWVHRRIDATISPMCARCDIRLLHGSSASLKQFSGRYETDLRVSVHSSPAFLCFMGTWRSRSHPTEHLHWGFSPCNHCSRRNRRRSQRFCFTTPLLVPYFYIQHSQMVWGEHLDVRP